MKPSELPTCSKCNSRIEYVVIDVDTHSSEHTYTESSILPWKESVEKKRVFEQSVVEMGWACDCYVCEAPVPEEWPEYWPGRLHDAEQRFERIG